MKDQLIAKIVANKRNKLSREQLATLDEPTLKALSESLEESLEETPADPPAPVADDTPAWGKEFLQIVKDQGEQIKQQGELIQQLSGQFSANAAVARQPLIDFITANTQLYTAETLAGMETEGLEKIYQLVSQASGKQAETVTPNYIGLGGRLGANSATPQIAKPPSLIEAIQGQRNGAAAN